MEPRQCDSLRRPAAAARGLPGLQLGQGPARLPLRRLLHAHGRRPDLRRVRERGRGAEHDLERPDLAEQLRAGPDPALQHRDQPPGLPWRQVHDAGRPAELPQQQPLQRVRTVRQRHLERDGPAQGEPRPALRVLRAAGEELAQVRLELLLRERGLLGEHQQPRGHGRLHRRRRRCSDEHEPDRRAVEERLEQLRPARRLRLGRQRRRQDLRPRRLRHGLRAQLRQRHLQRAVQPAGLPGRLDRRPDGHAGAADLHRQRGPVRRRRRRHQDDPGRLAAPRRPEHRDRLHPLLQRVDPARDRREHGGVDRVHGLDGSQPVRPRRPQQARRAARLHRRRHGHLAAESGPTPRSTPAATAASRGTTASPSASRRASWATPACSSPPSTRSARPRTTSAPRSRTRATTSTSAISTPSTRCSITVTRASTFDTG